MTNWKPLWKLKDFSNDTRIGRSIAICVTDAKGHIMSFSPEHKEVEMRINSPVTFDVTEYFIDSTSYTVTAV